MTYAEMSVELDVVYENINKNGAPGLDGYEKSVILTHAQDLFIKQTLTQDESGELFPELITSYVTYPSEPPIFTQGALAVNLPSTYLKILNEELYALNGQSVQENFSIVTLSHEEYRKLRATPYPYPRRRTAWKLSLSEAMDLGGGVLQYQPRFDMIVRPGYTNHEVRLRVIRKPNPIIVADLQSLSPFALGVVSTYTVSTGGTGYSVGDILTIDGTLDATFRVMTVSGGAVLTVAMLTNGYGFTAGAKATTASPSAGRSGCQITITVTNAASIDGWASPKDCELNPSLHRDILKIAAVLAEQYYMDKYNTNNNGASGNQ